MAICGFEFPDGEICGQSLGHNHPHLRWSGGHEYHERKFYLEKVLDATDPDSWAHNLAKKRLEELDVKYRKEY